MEVPPVHTARVGGGDALNGILRRVAEGCRLGSIRGCSVIDVGYEDCNVDLHTDGGRFVVKVFASSREQAMASRVVRIVQRAIKVGVRHPRLLPDGSGESLHTDPVTGRQYLVMEFAEGRTCHDLGRPPTDDELRQVVAQAVLFHSLDADVDFVFDPWAVPNIFNLSETVRPLVEPELMALVDLAAAGMLSVDPRRLPHVLIHGDLTKGNVLINTTGKVTVLDFAVANRYPRVQELAVIAANLMHGDPRPLRERARLLAVMYGEHDHLSRQERAALVRYTHAAVAMEFLGAARERHIKGNTSAETTRLLELGEAGLRMVGNEVARW